MITRNTFDESEYAEDVRPLGDKVTCPRCGGDGGDRYLCGLCEGQGKVTRQEAQKWKRGQGQAGR